LAPVQVTVLPVADRHQEYALQVVDRLRAAQFRIELVDAHADSLGARIRRAKLEKVPYVLVVGDRDVEAGTVGVNARGSEHDERGVALDAFVERLSGVVKARANV
jgi:threonyl-tRNA synthetase